MQPSEEVAPRFRAQLNAGDRRLLALAAGIIAISGLYVSRNYRAAFPQASLHLELSRAEINSRAEAFLRGRKLDPTGFRQLTLFEPDDDARLYLERQLGLAEANRLMATTVPVWRWRARWYRPPEKEEMVVYLAPDGRLSGFDHKLAEEQPGARLTEQEARRLAEDFLTRQSPAPHKHIESQAVTHPNRTDHVLTWEQEGFRASEATLRRTVIVRGGEVAGYSEYLNLPEQWRRDFTAMRSKNELYTQIAQAAYLLLVLAAMVITVNGIRRGNVQWRTVLLLSGGAGGLTVLAEWNHFPFLLDRRSTASPFVESAVLSLFESIGAGVGVLLYVAAAAAPGEMEYRRFLPGMLSLRGAFSRHGIRTREFFRATAAGYAMAAGHIAFITAFYLAGRSFGVWSPQDVEYSDMLSTALPWIYPLTISVQAATAEEFWFRLLAIPLLKRWTGSTWIAILVPAFVWGFLHANYPQQPAYVRGIEVGVIGVAAGLVLLRFGILATLIWHYTVDAALIGSYLLASDSWYFRLSGAAVAGVALLPLAASIWFYRREGGFLEWARLTNQAVPEPEEKAPAEVRLTLPPAAPAWSPRLFYVAAGGLLLIAIPARPPQFGGFLKVGITRAQAIEAAGRPEAPWRAAAEYLENLDEDVIEYLRQSVGAAEADRAVREHTWTGLWRVRYFRPGEKDTRTVFVDQDGSVRRIDLEPGEDAPGAQLSREEAIERAQGYLRSQGVALDSYSLLDSSSEQRRRRADHQFVWEHRDFRAGEARARISLDMIGDQPSAFRRYIKIPEQWLRERNRTRVREYAFPALAGGFLMLTAITFVTCAGSLAMRWRSYAGVGAGALVVWVISSLNNLPSMWLRYDTAQPANDFLADQMLGRVMWGALATFLAAGGAMVTDTVLRVAHGERRIVPAAWLPVAAFGAAAWAAPRIAVWMGDRVPGERASLVLWQAPAVETAVPGVAVLTGGMTAALATTLAATAILSIGSLLAPRRRWGYGGFSVVCAAASQATSAAQFAYHLAAAAALLGLVVLAVRTHGAAVWSLAGAMFLAATLREGILLASQPPYFWQGLAACATGVAMAAYWVRRMGFAPEASQPAAPPDTPGELEQT